ncbi:MAG: hypothetical protein LBU83_02775 [Bacteroidales bacterium]|jgi:hypothetical protein|nr:hypothetical protein [Bacteroidales bacterium]
MKIFQNILLLAFLFCGISLQAQKVFYETITKEDAQKYLTKLYANMQALHPNLYQHISKENYDKVYDELMQNLDTADYYASKKLLLAFQEFEALCRDGHSGVRLFQASMKVDKKNKEQNNVSIQSNPTFRAFPFIFNIVKGKLYVNYHCFGEDTIPIKSEIVSIGEETAQEWLQKKRAPLSGERDEYRDSKLNRLRNISSKLLNVDSCKFGYIPYGSRDTLYKTLNCKTQSKDFMNCNAKFLDEPGIFRDKTVKEMLTFRIIDDDRIGIITMLDFFPVKEMLPLINMAFDNLKSSGAEDLIIDLRKSTGGHAESGYALIDRITDKPYRTCSEEQFFIKSAMLTSSNKYMRKIWQNRTYLSEKELRPIMEAGRDTVITYQCPEIRPKNHKNKFVGRVWVLVGSQTFSAAVGVAAIIQDHKLGTVVGEETGGIPNTYGNQMPQILTGVLDEKLITFYYYVPHIKTIRPSGDDSMKLRGVIPDIEIEPNILLNDDKQLQTLIEIILKQRKN